MHTYNKHIPLRVVSNDQVPMQPKKRYVGESVNQEILVKLLDNKEDVIFSNDEVIMLQ
jgi:hypothetical protein